MGIQKANKRLRANGLTPEGWSFLLKILHAAGYQPFSDEGEFVVRRTLKEHFFLALNPLVSPAKLAATSKDDARQRTLIKLAARLQRLRPGHPQQTASEETLKALVQLQGLKDPKFLDRPEVHELLKG